MRSDCPRAVMIYDSNGSVVKKLFMNKRHLPYSLKRFITQQETEFYTQNHSRVSRLRRTRVEFMLKVQIGFQIILIKPNEKICLQFISTP